jgi:hypothetical protein
MPRYVVLTHDHPFLHWDLMLEEDGRLRTWRLLGKPQAGAVVEAESLPDHRIEYLDYEGPVSGGRGSVHRLDAGEYAVVREADGGLSVRLSGRWGNLIATLESRGDSVSWRFDAAGTISPD